MPSIAVVALPDAILSGVLGPMEIFALANQIVETRSGRHCPVPFPNISLVATERGSVVGSTGVSLRSDQSLEECQADIVILPPVGGNVVDHLGDRSLINWLKQQQEVGTILASSCAGAFFLAEAGLLDEKPATTHWYLADLFRVRYPLVDLQPQRMLVDGGAYICAGGVMAWQDLALHIIARFCDLELAAQCAKMFVMDGTRQAQTPYFMFDSPRDDTDQSIDPGVQHTLRWMKGHYQDAVSVDELAGMAHLGIRTFLRRFKHATGQTPMGYLQQLRIEAARQYLEITTKTIEEVIGLCGYHDSSAFRRVFKEKTGLTPKEYRRRFSRLSEV
ncbi:MAG: helix-turn-helix domain-containing protein [Okeania sp. SIO3C4]|nr:helix-turn-helix domain-containing protein [Okeania sp. SIO3C4]